LSLSDYYKRFPGQEYETRWKKAKQLTAERKLDAFLIADVLDHTYLEAHSRGLTHALGYCYGFSSRWQSTINRADIRGSRALVNEDGYELLTKLDSEELLVI
jgi:hypothetical protein